MGLSILFEEHKKKRMEATLPFLTQYEQRWRTVFGPYRDWVSHKTPEPSASQCYGIVPILHQNQENVNTQLLSTWKEILAVFWDQKGIFWLILWQEEKEYIQQTTFTSLIDSDMS